ncbi:MAG TPA: HDOD domain-containing protein [Syntrophobacteraceae bacterium]|nr:HDOD domain-containing protein [Syntrophobacteraceae bacterium]
MLRDLSNEEIKALHHELLLKDILAVAERLPPFPDVAWKVIPLIRRMAPVQEIEAVIRYDQAITARVLALSQSAYYGRKQSAATLKEAVLILGAQRLVQVILVACAARYFQGRDPGCDVEERKLWEHSVATALTAEILARRLSHRKVLAVYTASLLHDIGKTVLDLYAKMYLHTSLRRMRGKGAGFLEAERNALGIDHQELGVMIARRWKFPPEVVAAIGHHHCPLKAPSDLDIASIVYAANRMTHLRTSDEDTVELKQLESDPVFIGLGLSGNAIEDIEVAAREAMKEVVSFLTSPW